MIIKEVMIKFLLIVSKNIFFQELKLKITTSKLMDEIFMINQLMTRLSNAKKSEKYNGARWWLHDWLFIRFCLFWKKIQTNCSWLNQKKALDDDSRAIQQIIFAGKIKSTVANTTVTIYYIFEQAKETIMRFSKGTTKVL